MRSRADRSADQIVVIQPRHHTTALPHLAAKSAIVHRARLRNGVRVIVGLDPDRKTNMAKAVEAIEPVFRHTPPPELW